MPSYGKSGGPKGVPVPSPQVLRRLELALRHSEAFGGSICASLVIFLMIFMGQFV
jgi:hypothetical protein